MPEGTKSSVIIMEDPDVPLTTFSDWLVWNIPPHETIAKSSVPGIQGTDCMNSWLLLSF